MRNEVKAQSWNVLKLLYALNKRTQNWRLAQWLRYHLGHIHPFLEELVGGSTPNFCILLVLNLLGNEWQLK